MSGTMQLVIGTEVACVDGVCGDLSRVVIDPVARAITHLVVGPQDLGHLVPIDLVTGTAKKIQLRCTKSEFDALEDAEESEFVLRPSGPSEEDRVLGRFSAGITLRGVGLGASRWSGRMGRSPGPRARVYGRVPAGEVAVRRGDHVNATDGAIGRVQGLLIDPSDHRVTHILLDEGHVWGERRVAIPIDAVTHVGEVIRLSLTRDNVRDLPPVGIDHAD